MANILRCLCGEGFEAPASAAGTAVECPKCGQLVQVPAANRGGMLSAKYLAAAAAGAEGEPTCAAFEALPVCAKCQGTAVCTLCRGGSRNSSSGGFWGGFGKVLGILTFGYAGHQAIKMMAGLEIDNVATARCLECNGNGKCYSCKGTGRVMN